MKDFLGENIKALMESEMDEHFGYRKFERSNSDNYRNGYKQKRVNNSYKVGKLMFHWIVRLHLNRRL
ncbi:transposase [Eubacterium ramulus]|uniref:transposase n=1 Tax=Eubacterium ramulus TaxID=39490 RepID=UPI003D6D680D